MKSIDIEKELESINFKVFMVKYQDVMKSKENLKTITKKKKSKRCIIKLNKTKPLIKNNKIVVKSKSMTQVELFRSSTKILFYIAHLTAMCPIEGIFDADISKIRFTFFSWKTLFSLAIGAEQGFTFLAYIYILIRDSLSIKMLGTLAFTGTASFTTYTTIRFGSNYPKLIKEIADSALDAYVNPKIILKCNVVYVVVFILSLLEHFLAIISRVSQIRDCVSPSVWYIEYYRRSNPWLQLYGDPPHVIGFFLQIINFISTMNWSYMNILIISVSIYLESILKEINKAIVSTSEKKNSSPDQWKLLREDYYKATCLVRSVDDVISGVLLMSFASNLFFICYQLFYVLARGFSRAPEKLCVNFGSGPFYGYEYSIYLTFSIFYLWTRWLSVFLAASHIHTASLKPLFALFEVPSASYCSEVSRLIDQISNSTVALSGLRFFYVTRNMLLPVAGTIITYELVLLQFSSDYTYTK